MGWKVCALRTPNSIIFLKTHFPLVQSFIFPLSWLLRIILIMTVYLRVFNGDIHSWLATGPHIELTKAQETPYSCKGVFYLLKHLKC